MKTINDIDVKNKSVVLRLDFNVPVENGVIKDNSKIVKSLRTINYLLQNNCKVVILSHFGRIKSEEDKLKNSSYINGPLNEEIGDIDLRLKEELDREYEKQKAERLAEEMKKESEELAKNLESIEVEI